MALGFDVNVVPQSIGNPTVPTEMDRKYAGDNKLWVTFYKSAVFNEHKSNQEGRHIYDEVDYIRIITPGSRDVLNTEATLAYQRRFPQQWENYLKSQEQNESGTPIDMVPWLSVSQVQELRFFNIRTVEDIVNAPDTAAQKFPGFHNLRARAKTFLDAAANEAEKTKLNAALAERDREIAELKASNKEINAKLDKLLAVKEK